VGTVAGRYAAAERSLKGPTTSYAGSRQNQEGADRIGASQREKRLSPKYNTSQLASTRIAQWGSRMLINCAVYENGQKFADIPVERISEYLARDGCLVWAALSEPSPDEFDAIAEHFDLHPLLARDARQVAASPQFEEVDDCLLAILQTVERGSVESDELRVGYLSISVAKNYVLTVRFGTQRGFADIRARVEREPELLQLGSGYILYALMDAVVDGCYFPVLQVLERELDRIEEEIFKKRAVRDNIESLYNLKQKLVTLKHAVESMIQTSGRLFGGRVPKVAAGLGDYFRDVYEHLAQIDRLIEGVLEMLTTAVQVNLGLINLNATEVTKKLAAWGAMIAVPTMIGGIYGMNFENMPELKWTFGYPMALSAMVILDLGLFFWFRRIQWL
jgi:magnesium transporter